MKFQELKPAASISNAIQERKDWYEAPVAISDLTDKTNQFCVDVYKIIKHDILKPAFDARKNSAPNASQIAYHQKTRLIQYLDQLTQPQYQASMDALLLIQFRTVVQTGDWETIAGIQKIRRTLFDALFNQPDEIVIKDF